MYMERFAEAFAGFDDRLHSITISDARLPDLPLVYVNAGFTAFSGYPREEVLGRNCRFLQNGHRDQPGVEQIRQALRTETGCIVDLINYHRDGALILNRLSMHPVFENDGRLAYFLGLQSNVEPLVRVQHRLANHLANKGLRVSDLLGQ